MTGERLPPFFCPYCGEQDLAPIGPDGGAWRCLSCHREFELRAAGQDGPGEGRYGSRRRDQSGTVALVGGGPGDPGLLTVRGQELLSDADVVITDRLAPREALAGLGADVEIVEAGKTPRGASLRQDQINDLLVWHARAGRRVVRLKGGDPFVFGRGAEEALACAQAGVPVEVVPGVTSAVAVPARAGIPLTHRGLARDFAVVTGHLDPSDQGGPDWRALAAGPATLVLLMAVARLESITAMLIKHGRAPGTPAAVISDSGAHKQQTIIASLDMVAERARAEGVRPPAVVVIGEVIRVRDQVMPA